MIRVGQPGWHLLMAWAEQVEAVFDEKCWLAGSASRGVRDWHDIDVRMLMDDDQFESWFGRIAAPYDHSPRWRGLMIAMSWATTAKRPIAIASISRKAVKR